MDVFAFYFFNVSASSVLLVPWYFYPGTVPEFLVPVKGKYFYEILGYRELNFKITLKVS